MQIASFVRAIDYADILQSNHRTDITEAFEASHVVNVNKVEAVLAKYYVKEAQNPRNSPYTFKEQGFYKTLKRRVEPVLKVMMLDVYFKLGLLSIQK